MMSSFVILDFETAKNPEHFNLKDRPGYCKEQQFEMTAKYFQLAMIHSRPAQGLACFSFLMYPDEIKCNGCD
ncbi:hypothetical protein HGM15179_007832 [Zosterops borbonicus]|uniref:Uncharacterized protein n=1 Tax=Zosterops borbonicus TaxID=364589 RepID=A0A8K1LMP8_9PASS|nr:hypothetical protein HGM15179_007832 [Zosterops borbonicus]